MVDARQRRGLAEKPFLAALSRLIAETPDFVQAHLELANHWHSAGKPQKTLDAARLGLKYANALIHEGFNGRIEWEALENRPYLLHEHAQAFAKIDDKLSQEIVCKRSRHGHLVWPWELVHS